MPARLRRQHAQISKNGNRSCSPVIEIAGHDELRSGRNFISDEACKLIKLPAPAGRQQAEMNHHDMQRMLAHQHLHVQQAALLKTVVRHVLVLLRHDWPARQQRIAMLAMARDGVAAVHRVVSRGSQEIRLALMRPEIEVPRLAPMELAHLLQADQIGVELLDRLAEVVNLQAALRPDAPHPFVNVVGRDAKVRLNRAHPANFGSNRIASALDGEKQRSAASRQGSQTLALCSRGLSLTTVSAATRRLNTCSVLRVTPLA